MFDIGGLVALNLRLILSVVCGFFRLMVPKKYAISSPEQRKAAKIKEKYIKHHSPSKKAVLSKFKAPKKVFKAPVAAASPVFVRSKTVQDKNIARSKMVEKEKEFLWSAKERNKESQGSSAPSTASSEDMPLSQLKRKLEGKQVQEEVKRKKTIQIHGNQKCSVTTDIRSVTEMNKLQLNN